MEISRENLKLGIILVAIFLCLLIVSALAHNVLSFWVLALVFLVIIVPLAVVGGVLALLWFRLLPAWRQPLEGRDYGSCKGQLHAMIREIRDKDPEFDPYQVIELANTVFVKVKEAIAEQDLTGTGGCISIDVADALATGFEDEQDKDCRFYWSDVAVLDSTVVRVSVLDGMYTFDICFRAEGDLNILPESRKSGFYQFIRGRVFSEIWTFQRCSEGMANDWILSGINGERDWGGNSAGVQTRNQAGSPFQLLQVRFNKLIAEKLYDC